MGPFVKRHQHNSFISYVHIPISYRLPTLYVAIGFKYILLAIDFSILTYFFEVRLKAIDIAGANRRVNRTPARLA